jgi:nicotinamidase-related amidase
MAIWDDVIPADELALFIEKGYQSAMMPHGERPALLVVDMTNAFVTDDYPTGYAETGKPASAAIKRLIATAREMGVPLIYTRGGKGDSLAERGYWKDGGRGLRALSDEKRHTVYEELAPEPGDIVLWKSKPSAFFGTDLQAVLVHYKIDTVIVTGMVTSGCVRATAVDAFNLNYSVMLPEECVADRGQVSHKVSLFDIHCKYGDVMKLDEVIAYLDELRAPVIRPAVNV